MKRLPFGIDPSASLSQKNAEINVVFQKVPRPHPDFVSYSGTYTIEHGLVRIFAQSKVYQGVYGALQIKAAFDRVLSNLQNEYGPGELVMRNFQNAIYEPENEFFEMLFYEDGFWSSSWEFVHREDKLASVSFHVAPQDFDSGYMLLAYAYEAAEGVGDSEGEDLAGVL